MARGYTKLTFTDSVKVFQERNGVRSKAQRMEQAEFDDRTLTPREQEFIAERDSFYIASVLENGWPYVNHRGGPKGFLKVLDETTLGFADFRGNLQYITAGSAKLDGRVALFLMDYPGRRRLKIMAKAEFSAAADHPELLDKLEQADYRAQIERVVLLRVEAFDWNCPQHITPRFTEEQVLEHEQSLQARIAELEATLAQHSASSKADGSPEQ